MSTPLQNKRITLGLTGGIACYKSCTLVSRLAQAGATVSVIMTEAATRFVSKLTFESLSGRPVYTSLWEPVENHDSQHIALARECDLFLIAPASANTIAKLAHGICDNIVTTVALAVPQTTHKLIAPSMNADMWNNPITQSNIEKITSLINYKILGPAEGWQACRTLGSGRMIEPKEIIKTVTELF